MALTLPIRQLRKHRCRELRWGRNLSHKLPPTSRPLPTSKSCGSRTGCMEEARDRGLDIDAGLGHVALVARCSSRYHLLSYPETPRWEWSDGRLGRILEL